ncbi:MAG: glycerate kinase [Anderseniella sp.]|jgi:hydroxypyruvate reductase|nr:glycerate kinase [Anderseniella sp.]
MNTTDFLSALCDAAIAAAQPSVCLPAHLPPKPEGRTIVVGAGKASAAMAAAVEANWHGPLEGLVLTRYGHAVPCRHIEIVEAAHPVPDKAGFDAAARIHKMVQGLSADDLVLCLISGGGSALLTAPANGITLAEKQAVNKALLACGAPIGEMNCLRKHLSAIKGGRLAAAAHPARVVSLLISDVPGDDPSTVASGPTVPDPTTRQQALAIVDKYRLDVAPSVRAFLNSPAAETPKPGDPVFANADTRMIATPKLSIDAAAQIAREAGYKLIDMGDDLEGESREVGAAHAKLALETKGPAVILSGGETTVTLKGKGRGGRNAEYALALAIGLNGAPGISAVAIDTDGIDGSEDNAGARVLPDVLARASAKGVDAAAMLANNDAYGFFEATGDLVMTGPTLTNVNDFRAIVIEG